MSERLDYIGVRPCGCVTAWCMNDDWMTQDEVDAFCREMERTGREVRRMTLDDAKALGDKFMPFDHPEKGCVA